MKPYLKSPKRLYIDLFVDFEQFFTSLPLKKMKERMIVDNHKSSILLFSSNQRSPGNFRVI